jgi:titin
VDIFDGAQSNIVGGVSASAGNIVSGNHLQGVVISDPGTTGNVIEGNYIGVDATGTTAISNGYAGVEITGGAQSNLVGGALPAYRNIISGNQIQGVFIDSPGTTGNLVQGNFIGVDVTGVTAVSNAVGIEIYNGAQASVIGGTAPGAGNVISGNAERGVLIDYSSADNIVQGNYIGVGLSGTVAVPNGFSGVEMLSSGSGNLIGGAVPGAVNVISGNLDRGVLIDDSSSGTIVQGNYIGLDASGTVPVPNGTRGVEIFGSANGNVIGGSAGARNFIAGNTSDGVAIDNTATANVIQGNSIGLNLTNGAAGNGGDGIVLFLGAQASQLGGITPGAANLIGNNASDGIDIFDSTSTDNSVRGNSIFANGGGFNLFTSANLSAAAPSLTGAVVGTNTTIMGSLASLPSTVFHLDFYASPPPSSQAQASIYIGAKDVTTSSGGSVSFSVSVPATVPVGRIITATATDPVGNTSGLSSGVTVTAVDSVGDGIPNAWRAAHFGGSGATTNSTSCAACDPDHDGLSNLQEFLAGTNPTNASSRLLIGAPSPNGADVIVSFSSVAGVPYRVEFKDDVATAGWTPLADQIIGVGGLMQITDAGARTLPKRFYRLDVLP